MRVEPKETFLLVGADTMSAPFFLRHFLQYLRHSNEPGVLIIAISGGPGIMANPAGDPKNGAGWNNHDSGR
jgi:hypothetical protein